MNLKHGLVVSLVLTVAACGSSDEITVSSLENALSDSPKFQQVCVPFALDVEGGELNDARLGEEQIRFLSRLPNGKRANKMALEQMKQLVKADIYDDTGVERIGEGDKAIRYYTYRLTDRGRTAFIPSPQGNLLCIGKWQVDKINYYTEPTPANGVTMSQVSYEAKIKLEGWAKNLLKDNPHYKGLSQTETKTVALVKTNKGWRDIYSLP